MALKFTMFYVEDSIALFRQYKKLAEAAMAQVADQQLYQAIDEENNSIAIIVKHMAGNMRSRWTDFLDQRRRKTGSRPRLGVRATAGDPRRTDGILGARVGLPARSSRTAYQTQI